MCRRVLPLVRAEHVRCCEPRLRSAYARGLTLEEGDPRRSGEELHDELGARDLGDVNAREAAEDAASGTRDGRLGAARVE